MGLHQNKQFLDSKGNYKQKEMSAYWIGEDNSK